MIEALLLPITLVAVFFCGYLLHAVQLHPFQELRKRGSKSQVIITGKAKDTQKEPNKNSGGVGVVYRPSREQVSRMNRSDEQREEAEAWDETVGNLPEIKEYREKVRQNATNKKG